MATKQSLPALKDISFNPKTSGKAAFILYGTAYVLPNKPSEEIPEVLSCVCVRVQEWPLSVRVEIHLVSGRDSAGGCPQGPGALL